MTQPCDKIICSLGIGSDYFEMALLCLISAQRKKGDRYRFILFCRRVDAEGQILPEGIETVFIDLQIERLAQIYDFSRSRMMYRICKLIPFYLPEYLNFRILFLDADCIVLKPVLETVFEIIERSSIVLFGSYRPDDQAILDLPNYKLFMQDIGSRLETEFRNASINSGLVGRSNDNLGRQFSDALLRVTGLPDLFRFPGNYFNDEPYFTAAYQLVVKDRTQLLSALPRGTISTTHNCKFEINRWGRIDIVKNTPGLGIIEDPAIVHFVGQTKNPIYLKFCDKIRSGEEI